MGAAPVSTLRVLMLREARREVTRLSQGSWRDDTSEEGARTLGDYPVWRRAGGQLADNIQAGWAS